MKIILLYITLFLITATAFSQRKNSKIKALKIAFITERLDLTEAEAQKFWPIYNTFDKAVFEIRHKDMREIRQEIRRNSEKLSDDEAEKLLNRFVEAENKLHKQHVQLIKKLRNVIPPQKIILLKVAEEEFNRRMLERMRNMHRPPRNKNRP